MFKIFRHINLPVIKKFYNNVISEIKIYTNKYTANTKKEDTGTPSQPITNTGGDKTLQRIPSSDKFYRNKKKIERRQFKASIINAYSTLVMAIFTFFLVLGTLYQSKLTHNALAIADSTLRHNVRFIDSTLALTRQQLVVTERELRADMSVKFWQGERIGDSHSFKMIIKCKNHGKTASPKVDNIIKYAFSETDADVLFDSLKQSTIGDWWEYEAGEELSITPPEIQYPPKVMTDFHRSGKMKVYIFACATYIDVFGKLHHSIIGGSKDFSEGWITLYTKWNYKD